MIDLLQIKIVAFQTFIIYMPKSKYFFKNIFSKKENEYSEKFYQIVSQKLLRKAITKKLKV